jgi:hypothetical protein
MNETLKQPKRGFLLWISIIGSIFFFLLMVMAIFSSMCPKYAPMIEVPLYLMTMIGFIYWIWTSTTIGGVLLRTLLSSILGVAIALITSSYVHSSSFPFKWLDEGSQKRILERQQKMMNERVVP